MTIEYPVHLRYQPVQTGLDYKRVVFPEPEIFIDCVDHDLMAYYTGTPAPIIDYVDSKNRPKHELLVNLPVGKLEH